MGFLTPGSTMDVDEVMASTGGFGRYQVMLILLFGLINVLSSFHYFGQTFISVIPEFHCNLPEIDQHFQTRYWAPDSECTRYDRNLSGLTPPRPGENWPTRGCDTGWTYNLISGYETIISEMNWVCDDAWKPVLGQSLFFVGSVIGTLLLGIMSDSVGRRPTLVLANVIALIGNMTTAMATSLPSFSAFRLIAGMATDTNYVMMYIIVMEYMSPSTRTLGLNLAIGLFYTLGSVAVPQVALVLGTWRKFLLTVAAGHAIIPLYWCIVPESARWLMQKGRVDEAISTIEKVAHANRTVLPDEISRSLQITMKEKRFEESPSLLGLFKTPRLRRKTLILIFKSMVLTLCYDAISRNIHGLGYNDFAVFSITSMTLLPSCFIILMFQDKVGRKAMASGSLFLSGVFTAMAGVLLAVFGNNGDNGLTFALACVGRLGVNVAYNSGAQYAAELIPTEVRGQGVAAIHVAGYAAGFFSPYILYMANYYRALPELTLGGLSVMGAGLCLLLPETLNRELPNTLEDGELFGEGEKVWEFACCQNSKEKSLSTTHLVHASSNASTLNSV